MSNKEKDVLKERIKRAIKVSSQKLIEKKKALGYYLSLQVSGLLFEYNNYYYNQ